MNKCESRTEAKPEKKEPVALFCLLTNSYFLVGRHSHGAPLAPQHPVPAWRAVPQRVPRSRPDQVLLGVAARSLITGLFKKAWEVLRSQQVLFSLVMTALQTKTYVAGLIGNLADSEEDCDGWTGSLTLDPDFTSGCH